LVGVKFYPQYLRETNENYSDGTIVIRENVLLLLVLGMMGTGVFHGCIAAFGEDSPIVGVKAGDANTYLYEIALVSNDTSLNLYTNPNCNYYLPMDTAEMLVTDVSNTNITAKFTYHFKNGTTDTVTRWSDLTHYISDWEMVYFLPLNATGFNETVTRTYVGTSRLVNHLYGDSGHNFTQMWEYNGIEYSWTYNFTSDYYWDNATGTLAEYTYVATCRNGTYYSEMSAHVVVIESNIIPRVPEILGDCNRDGVVDIFDLAMVGGAFGSVPGQLRWYEAADMCKDGIIDVFDLVEVAQHYGETGS
jgi:hypothetical protein